MGIGTSIVLIAVGAILYYALEFDVAGIDERAAGAILMVIGIIGLVIALLYEFVWSDRRRGRATVYDEAPVVREREVRPPTRFRDRY